MSLVTCCSATVPRLRDFTPHPSISLIGASLGERGGDWLFFLFPFHFVFNHIGVFLAKLLILEALFCGVYDQIGLLLRIFFSIGGVKQSFLAVLFFVSGS